MPNVEAKKVLDLIKTLFSDEELIKECIEDVRKDIEYRETLAEKILLKIGENKDKVEPLLEETGIWAPGYKPSADARRTRLEQELINLSKEEREQLVGLFRNKAQLKKELRELLLKYKEAVRMRKLLEKLDSYDKKQE